MSTVTAQERTEEKILSGFEEEGGTRYCVSVIGRWWGKFRKLEIQKHWKHLGTGKHIHTYFSIREERIPDLIKVLIEAAIQLGMFGKVRPVLSSFLSSEEPKAPPDGKDDLESNILGCLRDNPGSANEGLIVELVDGEGEEILRTIRRMVDEGKIKREGRGKGGGPILYRLPCREWVLSEAVAVAGAARPARENQTAKTDETSDKSPEKKSEPERPRPWERALEADVATIPRDETSEIRIQALVNREEDYERLDVRLWHRKEGEGRSDYSPRKGIRFHKGEGKRVADAILRGEEVLEGSAEPEGKWRDHFKPAKGKGENSPR